MNVHRISDDAFAHMVAQEIRNNVSDEHRDFLRQPENLDRWMKGLNALLDNVNGQIEDAGSDMAADEARYSALGEDGIRLVMEAKAYYEAKISKAERFKFYVVRRISEVAAMISRSKATGADDEKINLMCKSAIIAHRRFIEENDIEKTEADEALYDALEGIWSFEKIEQTKTHQTSR